MDPWYNILIFLAKKIGDYFFDIKSQKRDTGYMPLHIVLFDVEFRNSMTDENDFIL